jgi:hypothetical protein
VHKTTQNTTTTDEETASAEDGSASPVTKTLTGALAAAAAAVDMPFSSTAAAKATAVAAAMSAMDAASRMAAVAARAPRAPSPLHSKQSGGGGGCGGDELLSPRKLRLKEKNQEITAAVAASAAAVVLPKHRRTKSLGSPTLSPSTLSSKLSTTQDGDTTAMETATTTTMTPKPTPPTVKGSAHQRRSSANSVSSASTWTRRSSLTTTPVDKGVAAWGEWFDTHVFNRKRNLRAAVTSDADAALHRRMIKATHVQDARDLCDVYLADGQSELAQPNHWLLTPDMSVLLVHRLIAVRAFSLAIECVTHALDLFPGHVELQVSEVCEFPYAFVLLCHLYSLQSSLPLKIYSINT